MPDLTTPFQPSCLSHVCEDQPQLGMEDSLLADRHFDHVPSILDAKPKAVVKRKSTNSTHSSPIKRSKLGSPVRKRSTGSLPISEDKIRLLAEAEKLLLRPCVVIEKLVYPESLRPRSMSALATYKSLDHLEVRPPPTAVHMVQLPNPPTATTSSHVATANGLPSSNDLSGHQPQPPQQQQNQDEAGKAASTSSSSTSTAQSSISTTSAAAVSTTTVTSTASTLSANVLEVINAVATASSSGLSEMQPHNNPAVTLVSTPAVSIFQVAHRPNSGNAGSQHPPGIHLQLQPISAVTGLANPVSPRNNIRLPNSSSNSPVRRAGNSGRNPPSNRPDGLEIAPTSSSSRSSSNNVMLAQLLAQSPGVADSTSVSASPMQSPSAHNGPPRQQGSYGRAARTPRRNTRDGEVPGGDSQVAGAATLVAGADPSAAGPAASRVPLVKYVDLDAVSSPTRARPTTSGGTGIAMRRASQGSSNSNSPDPHRAASAKSAGQRAASAVGHNNPSSPAMVNSPQSPALHPAPPSPLSFRSKQQQSHNAFSGNNKDRLTSPNHPSQCPSPFSRPSSRSQVRLNLSLLRCNADNEMLNLFVFIFCRFRMPVQVHQTVWAVPCTHQAWFPSRPRWKLPVHQGRQRVAVAAAAAVAGGSAKHRRPIA